MVWDKLAEIRQAVDKCMRCGNCQAVCPLYKEEQNEAAVARGKIFLVGALASGQLAVTKDVQEILDMCLLCASCKANCPCGVKVDEIILGARAAVAREKGIMLPKAVAFSILKKRGLFDQMMKIGSLFQGVVFKRLPDGKAARLRLPVAFDGKRLFPVLARRTFLDEFSGVNRVPRAKMRVLYFSGCMINYFYTDIGKAVLNVLKKNEVEVIVPKNQGCCGMPMYASGDVDAARELAKRNLDILSQYKDADAIITSCATCGTALKHDYLHVLNDFPEYKRRAEEISKKVFDIAEFLVDVIDFRRVKMGSVDCRVTYHDPCHLNRYLNVNRQPRAIIESIPGVKFVEMKNPGRCCGGAGSFSLTHYETSMAVFRNKAEDIRSTGAQLVLTGCPSCYMQLTDGLNRFGMGQRVLHTVEFLSMAYEKLALLS